MEQLHLSYKEMTNLGSFYTPEVYVDKLIKMIKKNIPHYVNYTFVDTSCGYGAFLNKLNNCNTIGCDIDKLAIEKAKADSPNTNYFNLNTLDNFTRKKINLKAKSPLIIIGNPPYNDTTSKAKNSIKNSKPCEIENDLKTRDLGISFMLSFNKMKPDYIAVLHPLSYMIKKTNYLLLKPFYKNYCLIDHIIINSQSFGSTSKASGFPIIIALYKKDKKGLSYDEIENMTWQTIEGNTFKLNMDSIQNYISKYPKKNIVPQKDDILFFTMRDINALKRSKTFLDKYSSNAIIIDKDKLALYCYVDIFKDYIKHIPYYLGNYDVFIDYKSFIELKDIFLSKTIEKYPYLRKYIKDDFKLNKNYQLIDNYFKNLLGGNYVE